MSAFKIGGSPFRPASGVGGGRKTEKKSAMQGAAPAKSGFDRALLQHSPTAVMPRMGMVLGQDMQHVQGEAVETLLRGSAAELNGYFTKALGFDGEDK